MTTTLQSDIKPSESDAYGLVEAAVTLDRARSDKSLLAAALDHNLQIWVAIGTLVERKDNPFPEVLKMNLRRLREFVSETTLKHGIEIADDTLTTLVNINLQISEGLLEGTGE